MYKEMIDPISQKAKGARRVSDGAVIPPAPANTDYAAYLEWVAAGNTPEPWQPDASAPSTE